MNFQPKSLKKAFQKSELSVLEPAWAGLATQNGPSPTFYRFLIHLGAMFGRFGIVLDSIFGHLGLLFGTRFSDLNLGSGFFPLADFRRLPLFL